MTNQFVLNNIRNEFKNRQKISNDPFKDAETTKLISDSFYPSNGLLKGFIHEIGLHPFGFIMLSDFQVQIHSFLLIIRLIELNLILSK